MSNNENPTTSVRCQTCAGVAELADGKPCFDCNAFGWMWADGLAPLPCIEDDVACGRRKQCDTCPNVQRFKVR